MKHLAHLGSFAFLVGVLFVFNVHAVRADSLCASLDGQPDAPFTSTSQTSRCPGYQSGQTCCCSTNNAANCTAIAGQGGSTTSSQICCQKSSDASCTQAFVFGTYDTKTVCATTLNDSSFAYLNSGACPATCTVSTAPTTSTAIQSSFLPPCASGAGNCQLQDVVQTFINLYTFGLRILVPLAVFFIIVGGVFLLTAGGADGLIKLGKTIINQAVIGTIIVLLSWVIINTVVTLLVPATTDKHGGTTHLINKLPWYSSQSIFSYQCPQGQLYAGCQDVTVKDLETSLGRLGYSSVKIDSVYDSNTGAAVSNFEQVINQILVLQQAASCSPALWYQFAGYKCFNPEASCVLDATTIADALFTVSTQADTRVSTSVTTVANNATFLNDFIRCKQTFHL